MTKLEEDSLTSWYIGEIDEMPLTSLYAAAERITEGDEVLLTKHLKATPRVGRGILLETVSVQLEEVNSAVAQRNTEIAGSATPRAGRGISPETVNVQLEEANSAVAERITRIDGEMLLSELEEADSAAAERTTDIDEVLATNVVDEPSS